MIYNVILFALLSLSATQVSYSNDDFGDDPLDVNDEEAVLIEGYLPENASDSEEIKSSFEDHLPERLTILGRGIQNRKLQQRIVLACETETCHSARFMLLNGNGTRKVLSDSIILPEGENEKALEQAQRLILKEYMAYHATAETAWKRYRAMKRGTKIGFLAGCAALILTLKAAEQGADVLTGGKALLYAAVPTGALMVLIDLLFNNRSITDHFFGVTETVESTTNQKGWNWTHAGKHIRRKTFINIRNQLDFGQRGYVTGNETLELQGYFESRKDKLRDKGITFHVQRDWR